MSNWNVIFVSLLLVSWLIMFCFGGFVGLVSFFWFVCCWLSWLVLGCV